MTCPQCGRTPQPIPLHWKLVERGVTGRQLAQAVGVGEVWISAVRRGHRVASPQLRAEIACYLGTPEAELFDPEPAAAAR